MKLSLLMRARPAGRVADVHAPGVWIGAYRRLVGPTAEVVETQFGDEVENLAPQYLVAVWKPIPAGGFAIRRFPAVARLVSTDSEGVMRALLKLVPDDSRLFVPEMEVDWGLIAQIAMVCDSGLRADQMRVLQAVVWRDREKRLEQIRRRYRPAGEGLRRFADTEPGSATAARPAAAAPDAPSAPQATGTG